MLAKPKNNIKILVWLVFFVVLPAGGAKWIDWAFVQAQDDTHIVDALGRQRMLSQAMGKSILSYAMARSSLQILQDRIHILNSYLDSMRQIYSMHVIPPAKSGGLVQKDFTLKEGKYIPVPASFTRMVNDDFGNKTDMSLAIISPNPINPEKKIITAHAQKANDYLIDFPHKIFLFPTEENSKYVLNFYTADTATDDTCITCHTKITGIDYELGDVLGIREYKIIFSDDIALGKSELSPSLSPYKNAVKIFLKTIIAMKIGGDYPLDLAMTATKTIQAIDYPKVQQKIVEIEDEFGEVSRSVTLLLSSGADSVPYRIARRDVVVQTQKLMELNNDLVTIYTAIAAQHQLMVTVSVSFIGLWMAVVLVIVGVYIAKHLRFKMLMQEQQVQLERIVTSRTADLQETNTKLENEIQVHMLTEASLQESQKNLLKLSSRMEEVRDNERQWIAQEVHDQLGGDLAKLNMDVCLLKDGAPNVVMKLEERLDEMQVVLKRAIKTVRKVGNSLNPINLVEFGVLTALEWELFENQKHFAATYTLLPDSQNVRMEKSREHMFYRIGQEALTNAGRHSQAQNINLGLYLDAKEVRLIIQDDGIGFDLQKLKNNFHNLGIPGMTERTRQYGGELTINTVINKGTVITARVPKLPDDRIEEL
jgi:signal transduction histidine kinase